MEGALLGVFMVIAGLVTVLVEYPGSPIRQAIGDPIARRFVTGLAMGGTAIALVYSRWGKRSGAHFNPAVTLTFLRLRKVETWDAALYTLAQFLGAVAGVTLVALLIGSPFGDPNVNYAATRPGMGGTLVAFASEVVITFVLMAMVLTMTNAPRLARYTGLAVGVLLVIYITLEAPLSGMSLNPARSLAPTIETGLWDELWIYFTGPLVGMLLAAETWVRLVGLNRVRCAKLHHTPDTPCIFRCGYRADANAATHPMTSDSIRREEFVS
jgi:aquaporin Z